MEERCFGAVRFIPGERGGRYPFCHSVYIEDARVLIDPASDRERLVRLRQDSGVEAIWLSHWHEDHIMHLDLFDDLPLWISEEDAAPLSDIDVLLDWYEIESEAFRRSWRDALAEQFHFRPRVPTGFLKGGQKIDLGTIEVEVIHTPGHTPGHLAFLFHDPGVLFMGDYDLTRFGPWYGDLYSNIDEVVASVERLRRIPARVWVTSHETGVLEEDPGHLWDQYLRVIQKREEKLLKLLERPRTLEEIVEAWIVYGRPREPKAYFVFGERAIMKKHLEHLVQRRAVVQEGERFHRMEDASRNL